MCVQGVPPEKCAGREGHDTPSMGGLVMLPAVVLAQAYRADVATTIKAAVQVRCCVWQTAYMKHVQRRPRPPTLRLQQH